MDHIVCYGESLWSISGKALGDPSRWPEIARLNHLARPDRLLIGQRLRLPLNSLPVQGKAINSGRADPIAAATTQQAAAKRPVTHIPARAFFFVIADEVNPLNKKLVRKIAIPPGFEEGALLERILHPESYGFSPRMPSSKVPIGRHVLGMTDSKYVSASERPLGSPRFEGKPYWIDVEKLQSSGATLHDGRAIAADLDRIAARTNDSEFKAYIEDIRQKSLVVDREVLVEGPIPAAAVKGAGAMAITRGLQVVEGVGIVLSIYDLGRAGVQSYDRKSVVPIAQESVRQVGGWAGALAGAEIGSSAGALLGIETGPGAIVTGAVGGFIFGVAGFLGADWAAKRIGAHTH